MIGLLTDFGTKDLYVGLMKAVIAGIDPGARVVDLSHDVARHDILQGAYFLYSSVPHLPDGAVVVSVVDPGVGTDRAAICARTDRHLHVCPDNGLLSYLLDEDTVEAVHRIENPDWIRRETSTTFHGRDIFAPAGARLHAGAPIEEAGPAMEPDHLVRLQLPSLDATNRTLQGEVVHVDIFGNLITNIPGNRVEEEDEIIVAGQHLHGLCETFSDRPPGSLLAYTGSGRTLEIAISGGSAAREIETGRGEVVTVKRGVSPDE